MTDLDILVRSLKTRATVVSVSYFDMDNQELDFETVEDASAKAKYGVLHKKITGFGCSSRGQAARLGRFLYYLKSKILLKRLILLLVYQKELL